MLQTIALLALLVSQVTAWTTGSSVSAFGGSVLVWADRPSSTAPTALTMKKGKSNLPPHMRGQYDKQQEMAAMREQMAASQKPGPDGFPVFNLFVRTIKPASMWYPCGSFKGDERSAGLAKNYASGGLFAGISKKQLDGGIAGSLYRDQEKLAESICRGYSHLRQSRKEFEYGYKLAYDGLSEEQAKEMTVVEPKENKGVLDNIKNLFS